MLLLKLVRINSNNIIKQSTKKESKLHLKIRAEPFPDTRLPFNDAYGIIDAVMQIPIDRMHQIQIYIYEYNGKKSLDIRQYRFNANLKVFQPTKKGIRLPIELLPQLTIRLQRLVSNEKKRNQFTLEL